MFDPSIKATGTLVAQPELAAKEIPEFVADVQRAVAAAAAAASLAANSVQVSPGGKTFATIGEALASITDAKQSKQYVVQVGPGTYNEVVVCKPWVFIAGAGTDQTTVTAPAGPQQWDKGTVRGCSNAAVQNMTIISTGQTFGDSAVAVNCDAAQNFDIENCALQATGDDGTNIVTVSIDYSSTGGGSQVNLAYSSVVANGGTQPIGLVGFANSYVDVTDTKIIAENAGTTWGAASNGGSFLTLYNCLVQGTMSLAIPDYNSKITARDCQLVGPYAPNVVIIND
ncbi:MAG TPA: pectinesterase family protein [Thermoanaerobaculia bacterium]|jgi:pectin methylesterase-like acyl-CoA thioesterase